MRYFLILLMFPIQCMAVPLIQAIEENHTVICHSPKETYVVDDSIAALLFGHGKHPDCLAVLDQNHKRHLICNIPTHDKCVDLGPKPQHQTNLR